LFSFGVYADFKTFFNAFPETLAERRRLLDRGGDFDSEEQDAQSETREESLLERSLTTCSIDIGLKRLHLPGILPDVPLSNLRSVQDVYETYKDREFQKIQYCLIIIQKYCPHF